TCFIKSSWYYEKCATTGIQFPYQDLQSGIAACPSPLSRRHKKADLLASCSPTAFVARPLMTATETGFKVPARAPNLQSLINEAGASSLSTNLVGPLATIIAFPTCSGTMP
ncbi:unnamed protein product, partial [Calicophoron daubneyi]